MHAIDITNVMTFLLSLPAGGTGITLIAELFKRIFGMNSSKIIHLLVMGLAVTSAVTAFALKYNGVSPWIMFATAPGMYGISQLVYKSAKLIAEYLPKTGDFLVNLGSALGNKQSAAVIADPTASVTVPEALVAPATANIVPATTLPNKFKL